MNYITNKLNLLLSKEIVGYIKGSEEFKFSRFTTTAINAILKPIRTTKRRWKNKEPLLFEFSLEKENARLVFLISVSNFNMDINDQLDKIFCARGLSGDQFGDGWRIYNTISIAFDYSQYLHDDYIQNKFNELYALAEPTIKLVEQLVIENKVILDQVYNNEQTK